MTEHYRFQREDELIISGDFLHVEVDCGGTPPDPRSPTSRWYCGNTHCEVREVTIEAKYIGRTPPNSPPTMRCPACAEELRFGNYVSDMTLLPVSPGDELPC